MAGNSILILKEDGQKKVKITDDGYGIELCIMRNGFQWTAQEVDENMLRMLREAVNEYLGTNCSDQLAGE